MTGTIGKMHRLNIMFLLVVGTVIKAGDTKTVSGTVKEFDFEVLIPPSALEAQVQKILDMTTEINRKVDATMECACPRYRSVVFHVANGRYTYNFKDAEAACAAKGATLATPSQLQAAWKDGLDLCAAGWLSDGTVRYPINMPRPGCCGENKAAGVCNRGSKPKDQKVADAYCFKFYY